MSAVIPIPIWLPVVVKLYLALWSSVLRDELFTRLGFMYLLGRQERGPDTPTLREPFFLNPFDQPIDKRNQSLRTCPDVGSLSWVGFLFCPPQIGLLENWSPFLILRWYYSYVLISHALSEWWLPNFVRIRCIRNRPPFLFSPSWRPPASG